MADRNVKVTVDPRALAAFVRSGNGPVLREMVRRGDLVKTEAKRLVGVSTPDPLGRPRGRRHGQLRDSIVKRVVQDPTGPVVEVAAIDPIALWHHEGTRPHVIRARRAPFLVFFWPKVGRVVRFKQVNHPGTKPNRFLTNALRVLPRR